MRDMDLKILEELAKILPDPDPEPEETSKKTTKGGKKK